MKNHMTEKKSSSFYTIHQQPMASKDPNADDSQGHTEGK